MKKFIDELSKLLKYEHRELIEIDLLLCKILFALSQNEFFYKNFLFKGGTCLIKNYLDYYRFSKDIDFTWKNQEIFKNKSRSQLKKYRSNLINKIGKIIEEICKKNNLDFINDKSNSNYFEFGGGNKMVTFRLYYLSEVLDIKKEVRFQINFVECLKFTPKLGKLKCVIPENEELIAFYSKEYSEYSKEITFPIYNIKEILCEKIRAILTRKGIKARDFFDIYLILNKNEFTIEDIKNQTVEKILFALNQYDKYRENLEGKRELINSGKFFTKGEVWGEEENLLFVEINNKAFYTFVDDFNLFLKDITEEIYEKMSNS